MTVGQYITENAKRVAANGKSYNPLTGEGATSLKRVKIEINDAPITVMWIPMQMAKNGLVRSLIECKTIKALLLKHDIDVTDDAINEVWRLFVKVRIRFDFEYWAYEYVIIKKKNSPEDIPFFLNRGQRKLLSRIYNAWLAGKPIRIILLKARQWGGSTLIQMVMIWIQLVHRKQWHSVICAHVENTAKVIRGMYSKMLKNYPLWLLNDEIDPKIKELALLPFENSTKTKQLKQRDCRITVGSAEKPDGIRGDDTAMAHLSEIGLWKATQGKKPEDLVQAITSGIGDMSYSMIVYESTAKGVGNFFHKEWLRAKRGESGYDPVFVAWFDIDLYQTPIADMNAFILSLSPEEAAMFNAGATLEGINWYRTKKKGQKDLWRFVSEFPSNDIEAFQSTGRRFYPIDDIARLRSGCRNPIEICSIVANEESGSGAMTNVRTIKDENGQLKIWETPTEERYTDQYVVVVDIGGISAKADNSVITVFDRHWMTMGGVPEVVAEWCGHIDHDKLAWLGVMIAVLYRNAILVIESNTLETEETEGDHFEFILDEISRYYDNLFCRTPADKIKAGIPPRWGFHTNKSSKQMVCNHQRKAVREDMYIEACMEACDEHDTFEIKENGSLGAVDGCRDDRHITRAIGVWVCYQYLPIPTLIKSKEKKASNYIGDGISRI